MSDHQPAPQRELLSVGQSLSFPPTQKRRRLKSLTAHFVISAFAIFAILPLIFVFYYIASSGIPAMSMDVLTNLPAPPGESGGGLANAIVGSLTMVILSSAMAIPPGLCSGLYIAEFPTQKLARFLRFVVDLLTGVPSIVIGLFAYAVIVVPMKGFSAWAGSCSLAIIMFPVVSRTTEEILRLIPSQLREAGLALGLPRWKVLINLIMRAGRSAIATGIFLGIARASGETAPLLFTAFGNQYWANSLNEPTASLPVQIYTYATSPYEEWHQLAWAGSLILVAVVFSVNLLSRLFLRKNPT